MTFVMVVCAEEAKVLKHVASDLIKAAKHRQAAKTSEGFNLGREKYPALPASAIWNRDFLKSTP
jgi:hypothetical protein